MAHLTRSRPATVAVPPPRRHHARALGIHALQLVETLALLPLALTVLSGALPAARRSRGRPRRYPDAAILLLALLARTWQLSYAELCEWLVRWPALAAACGLPPGRVIHPAHLSRRVRRLGGFPLWCCYLALVALAVRRGLLRGRDVVLDSTLLAAWHPHDPNAAWARPASRGGSYGYKLHLLLDRPARLPVLFALSPANAHDGPFARPLLAAARVLFGLSIRLVRADGAYWSGPLVRWLVEVLHAEPVIPFNRRKQPLARVRQLARWPLDYAARAVIERAFAVAKRYYGLNLTYVCGQEAVTQRVTLTCCAMLLVALAAHQAGARELRLSPTRVLAHYQPVEDLV